MSSLQQLQQQVAAFIDARDWRQFHDDPKGLLMDLGSEVGELMEIYRFTTTEEAKARTTTHRTEVEDEAADILYVLLMFCDEIGIDLERAFASKLRKNEAKYPAATFKGKNAKYNAADSGTV